MPRPSAVISGQVFTEALADWREQIERTIESNFVVAEWSELSTLLRLVCGDVDLIHEHSHNWRDYLIAHVRLCVPLIAFRLSLPFLGHLCESPHYPRGDPRCRRRIPPTCILFTFIPSFVISLRSVEVWRRRGLQGDHREQHHSERHRLRRQVSLAFIIFHLLFSYFYCF